MNDLVQVDMAQVAAALAALYERQSANGLGLVDDDWAAVEVWLDSVAANSRNGSTQTVDTYRFHIAKLRWFCENEIGLSPSRWSVQEVNAFQQFLAKLPDHALCALVEGEKNKWRRAVRGEGGYTPFRKQPSASSGADILRCTHAMFKVFHGTGYIRMNPMQLIKARKARRIDTARAISIDLYDEILQQLARQPIKTEEAHRLSARDRFILIALREMGLRASELVGAHMTDLSVLTDQSNRKTYWVFKVREETAKGGVSRTVPFTNVAMEAFLAYRRAFGLPPLPDAEDKYPLLLSPRTAAMFIGEKLIRDAESRRFFGSWGCISSRKSLYHVVKGRLAETAAALRADGRHADADALVKASPHWLRHTFAKAAILNGRDIRVVAALLGHASVTTTMIYTEQDALDVVRAHEKDEPGGVAQRS